MGTIYDVARLAGVSTATVSRLLNGTGPVSEATAARIRAAIEQSGYVVNRAARSLTTKNSGLIGFLTSDLTNPFTSELAHAMTERASRDGFSLLTAVTFGRDDRFVQLADELRQHQVDGIIATPPETPTVIASLQQLDRAGIPVVTIGITVPGTGVDFVSCNTYDGGLAAMRHLTSQGHRRIALLTGTPAESVAGSRFRAYRDALDEIGVGIDADLVMEADLDRESGLRSTAELLRRSERPTAVFAVNDMIAIGALQACHAAGVDVPGELSIVGFDDVPMASLTTPMLTTVSQPRSELGATAADLLVQRLQGAEREPVDRRLLSTLVVRDSSGPAPT
ncbi:LacI family DNA-binding transcriptional regulator [Desertihabitans aurantiacus]|uniref:LacI family DNA-binding transcriptional regulator n=1 Tax=Desertihabitans aurantiacus TaxID=2282477 RepID=UPI0018E4F1D7|nr:LacI family DNA-binding transcriptional regulator [Desertihabitans aurantiacus]